MLIVFSSLLMALAAPSAGQPAIVLAASPDPAPRTTPATRCGPSASQGDGAEVECLIESPATRGEARPAMRILIRTSPAPAPCLPAAPSVALMASEVPAPAGSLPVVVQGAAASACR